ncbi:MAG: hypothetical protein ACRCYP_04745 [Alphaproteobacteria bacterium]
MSDSYITEESLIENGYILDANRPPCYFWYKDFEQYSVEVFVHERIVKAPKDTFLEDTVAYHVEFTVKIPYQGGKSRDFSITIQALWKETIPEIEQWIENTYEKIKQ